MNTKRLISLFAATAGLALASTASADEALLNLLVDKGIVTRAEAAQLMAESKSSAPSRPIVTSSSTNLSQLRIRGRIQTQFGYADVKNDNGSGKYSTFEMRRVRMGMQGQLLQNVRARVEANMVPGSGFSMRSAYVQWREHDFAHVKVGYDKPEFGFEENTSSASILTVERSLITNTVAPGPVTGLTVNGKPAKMFSYSAGIYTNRDNTNQANNDSGRYLFNLSGSIKLDDLLPDGNKLTARVDLLKNNDTGGNFGYEDGFSISGHYQLNAFDLRAEYIQVSDFNNNDTKGWYVMPSFFFTDKFQGVVRYEQAKSDLGNGLRAASRYARRADLPGLAANDTGDKYDAIYFGGNYYLAGDAHKLMAGLEISKLKNTPLGDLKATTVFGAWRMLF